MQLRHTGRVVQSRVQAGTAPSTGKDLPWQPPNRVQPQLPTFTADAAVSEGALRHSDTSLYAHLCTPTSSKELEKFLSLTVNMIIVQKQTVQSYWSNCMAWATSSFASVMPRNIFWILQPLLHFNDSMILLRHCPGTIQTMAGCSKLCLL